MRFDALRENPPGQPLAIKMLPWNRGIPMSRTKSYDELTFADDFMFCKILVNNPDLCEELVSLVVGKDVRIVHIEKQAPIEETSDGRGVRLDVYVEGDDATIYDIEMQTTDKETYR